MPNGSLNPGQMREFLDYDPETGILTWKERAERLFPSAKSAKTWNTRFAGKRAMTALTRDGYYHGHVLDRKMLAHRVCWAVFYGVWPDGQIDHINGVRDDNRIANLREVEAAENQRNMKTPHNNTSGHIGVGWESTFWRARLGRRHIGTFKTFEEAVSARRKAEREGGYHSNHGR